MRLVRRCLSILLMCAMMMGLVACGGTKDEMDKTISGLKLESEKEIAIWYCNEQYTDYLNYVADRVHKVNGKLTLKINLVAADNYLGNIYDESVRNNNAADIFLINSSELEKAHQMGLMAENSSYADNYVRKNYSKTAISAATFGSKLYGYPLGYNVAYMVYNKSYANGLMSFGELEIFNESFAYTDETSSIKQIVTWDISDMFKNFAFSAGSINVGGEDGDDKNTLTVDVEKLEQAMSKYLEYKNYYGIEKDMSSEEFCKQMFCENTLAYTILDIDELKAVQESDVSFGIMGIPDMSDTLKPVTMSDTMLAVVNTYSSDMELSRAVANALSFDYASELVETTGLLPARHIKYTGEYADMYDTLYNIYDGSQNRACYMGSSYVYTRYEIMLNRISSGTSVADAVGSFVTEIKANKQADNNV